MSAPAQGSPDSFIASSTSSTVRRVQLAEYKNKTRVYDPNLPPSQYLHEPPQRPKARHDRHFPLVADDGDEYDSADSAGPTTPPSPAAWLPNIPTDHADVVVDSTSIASKLPAVVGRACAILHGPSTNSVPASPLIWDISKPPSDARLWIQVPPTASSSSPPASRKSQIQSPSPSSPVKARFSSERALQPSELAMSATLPPRLSIKAKIEGLPDIFHPFEVTPRNMSSSLPRGSGQFVTVEDVLREVHDYAWADVSKDEFNMLSRQQRKHASASFHERYERTKRYYGEQEAERTLGYGLRRLDVLGGQKHFAALTPPEDGRDLWHVWLS